MKLIRRPGINEEDIIIKALEDNGVKTRTIAKTEGEVAFVTNGNMFKVIDVPDREFDNVARMAIHRGASPPVLHLAKKKMRRGRVLIKSQT